MLASFSEARNLLSIDLSADEQLTIVSSGTDYSLPLNSTLWHSANVTGDGLASLMVTAAGTTAGDFIGLGVSNVPIALSGSGNISLTGNGSDNAFSSFHFGVYLQAGVSVTSTASGLTAGTNLHRILLAFTSSAQNPAHQQIENCKNLRNNPSHVVLPIRKVAFGALGN